MLITREVTIGAEVERGAKTVPHAHCGCTEIAGRILNHRSLFGNRWRRLILEVELVDLIADATKRHGKRKRQKTERA